MKAKAFARSKILPLLFPLPLFVLCFSCSVQQRIGRSAKRLVNDAALLTAHVGIAVYDPAANKYVYNYQGDKYFVPASNVKIPTCYAAMKYLGDSLAGIRYATTDTHLFIEPTGDPTFLHPEFKRQPVSAFLQATDKEIVLSTERWQDEPWGSGWSWGDYARSYMAERSAMPIYGNVVRFSNRIGSLKVVPPFFAVRVALDSPKVSAAKYPADVKRALAANEFLISADTAKENETETPFFTERGNLIFRLLPDTLRKAVRRDAVHAEFSTKAKIVYSQPTDSLLKPMMHRSDNFFAEQALFMVSNELLGVMNDEKIIDTLLKTDLADLPHKPRWADGSGLSCYNLFTPQDFIVLLNKMKNAFGMERLKVVFPTGGQGTISNYYKKDSGYIFAKTGTLSGVVTFSGYLYTQKNKLLLFSILVNNHRSAATAVRRAVERFLQRLREEQ